MSNIGSSKNLCCLGLEMKILQSKAFLSRQKQVMQKRKTYWEDAMQNAPI